jgi:hypothetical protein
MHLIVIWRTVTRRMDTNKWRKEARRLCLILGLDIMRSRINYSPDCYIRGL